MPWKIYYDNGSTKNDKQGLPETTDEHLGVIVIAQVRGDGRYHQISGAEYYIFDGEFWVPIGLNGLEDWTMNLLPRIKCVTKGRAIAHGHFNEIYKEAKEAVRTSNMD